MARIKNDAPRSMKNLPDASIPAGTTFTGNIDTMGGVRVDGTVKGNVKAGGDITIGVDGEIDGNVSAINVNIAGKIHGNLTATGAVQMLNGSKLTGDLTASSFAIENGAYYKGKCMITDGKDQPLLSAPAEAHEKKSDSKSKAAEKPAELHVEKPARKSAEKATAKTAEKAAEETEEKAV